MTRIEWSQYKSDVEPAAAMFIGSDFPSRAEYIKPSKGDGGIDILVHLDAGYAVYQVKNFTQGGRNLTTSQKNQIRESMDALISDRRVADVRDDLREWLLVAPMNPTPETRLWLKEEAASRGIPEPVWKGEEAFHAWAAKYPEIVDYYFKDSRETIRAKAEELLATFKIGQDGDHLGSPSASLDQLVESSKALSAQDPHYRYGLSTIPIPEGTDVSKFVTHYVQGLVSQGPTPAWAGAIAKDGWVAVLQVFAKTSMSTTLEPIVVHTTMTMAKGSAEHQRFLDFVTYGTALTLPQGSVNATFTGPGGVTETREGAALRLTPHSLADSATTPKMRCLLLDPDGVEITQVELQQKALTRGLGLRPQDPLGMESVFVDAQGLVTVVARALDGQNSYTTHISVSLGEGRHVVDDVLPVVRLMAGAHAPNRLLLAPVRVPYNADNAEVLDPPNPDTQQELDKALQVAEALAVLQQLTPVDLHIPDPDDRTTDWEQVITAGELVAGRIVEHDCSEMTGTPGLFTEAGDRIQVRDHVAITLPETTIQLGEVTYTFRGHSLGSRDYPGQGPLEVWQVDGSVAAQLS